MTHTFKTSLLAGLTLGLMATTAFAGGFAIREQSAEGQGASFAGVAAGSNGLSSMFWNPATMSQHNAQGFVSESDASLIVPYSRAKNGVGAGTADSGNIGVVAVVPASYWTYGISDKITVGASFNAPFGLTTNANNTWAGAIHGDKSAVATYNLAPSVAYKANDWITLGVGVQLEYMTVDINNRNAGVEVRRAKADDFGFGFSAGILLEPTAQTDIGIGFRSSINHNLEGQVKVPAVFDIHAGFENPETVTLGVRQSVGEQLDLLAGIEWANWSRFKELRIIRSADNATVGLTKQNWKDGWFYSLGAEYEYNDALMLRAGVAFEKSPVPDAFRTPRSPDNDRYWLSAGATYKLSETMTANLAYSHVFMDDGGIALAAAPSPEVPAPLTANFKQHLDIVTAGMTVDW